MTELVACNQPVAAPTAATVEEEVAAAAASRASATVASLAIPLLSGSEIRVGMNDKIKTVS